MSYTITKCFHILPMLTIGKTKNTFSKHTKIEFTSDWNYYYYIRIGWLFWDFWFYSNTK